jgi:hypothetical protein
LLWPAGQLSTQVPDEQICTPSQAFVHEPHFAVVDTSVSQMSSGLVVQCALPAAHALGGMTQTESLQEMPVAFGARLGDAVQSCPQAPQFFGSAVRSAQPEGHCVLVQTGAESRASPESSESGSASAGGVT